MKQLNGQDKMIIFNKRTVSIKAVQVGFLLKTNTRTCRVIRITPEESPQKCFWHNVYFLVI